MRDLSRFFKALSDPNRLRILKMLEIRPLCVCEITEILQLATSTVSKHLSILRDAGLILDNKEGKWVNYQLNHSADSPYVSQILPLLHEWLKNDPTIKNDSKMAKNVNRDQICSTTVNIE
ncbi:MAG: hypothetical protein Kow0037_02610 [Calditrichia bacterium]